MKHLTVIYNPGTGPIQLFDGPVEELLWADSGAGIRVEGKTKKAAAGSSGLMELLSTASKAKTAAKKAELEADQ